MTIFRDDGALDVRFDLFYNSRWNEIPNEDTRNSLAADGGVRISRGRPNESGQTQPTACSVALSDFDGKYSLRNPFSPLFGLIGLNTPLRVRLAGSTFEVPPSASIRSKTVTDDDTLAGADPAAPPGLQPGDVLLLFITINLRGLGGEREPPALPRMGLPRGGEPWEELAGVESFDPNILLSEATTGATKVYWKIAGPDEPATYDISSVAFNSSQSFNVVILAIQNASHVRPHAITVAEPQFGTTVTTQASLPGATNLELRWVAGHGDFGTTTFPLTWTMPPGFTEEAGFYGVGFDDLAVNGVLASRALSTLGDTGEQVFTCSSQVAFKTGVTVNVLSDTTPIRSITEIAEWPPRWIESSINAPVDKDAGDVWVPLQGAGILRRLGQGTKPLRSALYRVHIASENVVYSDNSLAFLAAYWPLEDNFGATEATTPLMGVGLGDISGAVTTGAATPFPGAASVFSFDDTTANLNFEQGTIPSFPAEWTVFDSWVVSFVFAHTDNEPLSTEIFSFEIGDTSQPNQIVWEIEVNIDATGTLLEWELFESGTPIDTGTSTIADFYQVQVRKASNVISVEANGDQVLLTPGGQPQTEQPEHITFRGEGANQIFLSHVALWAIGNINTDDAMPDIQSAIDAYTGEAAGRRLKRISREERIPFYGIGDLDDTALMGPQPITETLTALRECEIVDMGVLYEPRDQVGLVYRTRLSLYSQAPRLELTSGAAGEVIQPLTPTDDDQQLRNDITVTRSGSGGGSFRVVQETGPLSIEPPPGGVGSYDTEVQVNVFADTDLPNQANERLRFGTVDEARYPNITLDLLALEEYGKPDLLVAAAQLDVGDRLTVDQPPPWLPLELIDQLAFGFTESLREFGWDVSTNNTPEQPYGEVAEFAGPGESIPPDAPGRYDTAGSRTIGDFQVGVDTQLQVETVLGQLWITDDLDLPLDIELVGVQLRVTQIVTNQPTLRSVSSVATGTTGSFSIDAPAGLQPGDLLVAFHTSDSGATADMQISDANAGTPWRRLAEVLALDTTGGVLVSWKIAGTSEPATYDVSQNSSSDGVMAIAAIINGRNVVPNAQVQAFPGIVTTALPTPAGWPLSDSLELRWASFESTGVAATISPPGDFTEQAEENSNNFVIGALASRDALAPGPPLGTGVFNFTASVAFGSNDRHGATVNVIGTQVMTVQQQPINARPGGTKLVLAGAPVSLWAKTRYGL